VIPRWPIPEISLSKPPFKIVLKGNGLSAYLVSVQFLANRSATPKTDYRTKAKADAGDTSTGLVSLTVIAAPGCTVESFYYGQFPCSNIYLKELVRAAHSAPG
jgi:hypothetical protein